MKTINVNIHAFHKKFCEIYGDIYDNYNDPYNDLPGYSEAVEQFDQACEQESFLNFVREYVAFREYDPISSDRECAAFIFTLAEMTEREGEENMSATKIDNYVYSVMRYLAGKYGISVAEREISPLTWYINTGRASLDFLHKLIATKPFMIARRLHKGGSDSEVIDHVKKCIGYKDML